MPELTARHLKVLERLRERGFQWKAFPLYTACIGVVKGNCAALLAPLESAGMKILGEPCYLVAGNLSVRVTRGGQQWFVCKKNEVLVTPQRQAELERFAQELSDALGTAQ